MGHRRRPRPASALLAIAAVRAWEFNGRPQLDMLHRSFRCDRPLGDCSSGLHSLQHMPLLTHLSASSRCVQQRVHKDLRLEVSMDARCLPGLPLNVTCFSVSELYPRAHEWPHGHGLFRPLAGCAGNDPDFLDMVCTLRCTENSPAGRHLQIFCALEFDRKRKYGFRERHVHIDWCDLASFCPSPSREDVDVTCFAGKTVPESEPFGTALLLALDLRVLLSLGCLLLMAGACLHTRAPWPESEHEEPKSPHGYPARTPLENAAVRREQALFSDDVSLLAARAPTPLSPQNLRIGETSPQNLLGGTGEKSREAIELVSLDRFSQEQGSEEPDSSEMSPLYPSADLVGAELTDWV